MAFATTLNKLVAIHQANFSPVSITDIQTTLGAICSEYIFGDSNPFPIWFEQMLDSILNRDGTKTYFPDLDSSTWSVIAELGDQLQWEITDFGEAVRMEFPFYQVSMYISTEGRDQQGRSACYFQLADRRQYNNHQ